MQLDIFNYECQTPYVIKKPIRLIELFAGKGAQAKALERLKANFVHWRICEFDKYAVATYNAIHGTNFKTSDITQITAADLGITDTDKYEYIMTYSFPCTDLSVAGKQAGMAKGSGTRSGLLWEVERLLKECKELPQVLLMENVPQVLNCDFGGWLEFLEGLGYRNYYQKLNAKDYGIPQNRDRVFMVSTLGDYYYEFPKPIPLQLRLKDMLDATVDEKYYLSPKLLKFFTINTMGGGQREPKILEPIIWGSQQKHCAKSTNGICPTLTGAMGMGGGQVPIMTEPITVDTDIKQCVRKNYEREKEQIAQSDKEIYQCECESGFQDNKVGIKVSPTLRAGNSHTAVYNNYRIRKLTPLECFRLMGFDDSDFYKAKAAGISDSQLYKIAGNSIVVQVLEHIFEMILKEDKQ